MLGQLPSLLEAIPPTPPNHPIPTTPPTSPTPATPLTPLSPQSSVGANSPQPFTGIGGLPSQPHPNHPFAQAQPLSLEEEIKSRTAGEASN